MATTETITILKVGTDEAVQSVADLKDNVKELKHQLDEATIGTQEYQDTLSELKVNQNALKDAMYATTSSMEDLTKAATGTSETYNSLVHRMAAYKEELRNIDVSTEQGKQRFKELAGQVNEVNDKLKEMDAMQGNYQRNVGNYTSALTNLGGILKQLPPTLGATKEKLGKVGETMQLVGKQPILGIIGLLTPMLMKIADSLKDNETATNAINKALTALKPVMNMVTRVVEVLAGWLSKAVDLFVKMAGESGGTFEKIIAGAVGVGNVLLQYILTPIKTIISAFKGLGNIVKDVFTGQFAKIKDDAATAWEGVKDAFSNGFSFKANFEKGKEVGAQFLAGLKDKEQAEKVGETIGESIADGIEKGIESRDYWSKMLTMADKIADERRKEALAQQKELNDLLVADEKETEAEVEAVMAEYWNALAEDAKRQQETKQMRIQVLSEVAKGTSSLLGSIADMYEADEENAEKNAGKIKALRIASATIDTISGAISAYMAACSAFPGTIAGPIVGAIQAAAVLAAGFAQIAQIKNTKVGSSTSDSSSASTSSVSAIQAAPTVSTQVSSVRTVTTSSEEDRLNQMAQDQRVYILASDIEASQNQIKTQVSESSF